VNKIVGWIVCFISRFTLFWAN